MLLNLSKPTEGDVGWAAVVNQNFTDIEKAAVPAQYGDGSDGNVTINSFTTLTRDMYYDALTVTSSAVLNTGGYRIFAKTSVTIDAGSTIRNNASGSSGATGNTLGSGASQTNDAFSSLGGNGGTSASFEPGGTAFDPPSNSGTLRWYPWALAGHILSPGYTETIAGGAGGGSNFAGEVGGGGGGVVLIATKSLVNNGAIQANGANGTGGGGGGGGGVVILVYGTKSGSGTATASAGSGGTGAQDGTVLEITA